jgi:ATP-binding cassette subfamily C protein LapB
VQSHASVSLRSRLLSQIAVNSAATAQQVSQVGIVVFGVYLIMHGELTLGALIATIIISGRAHAPLGQIANTLARFNHARTSFQALNGLMTETDVTRDAGTLLKRDQLDGRVELKNVTLRYAGRPDAALEDISLTIESGEKVAILGSIGSGKSSLARVVSGLYDPSEGMVMMGQTDIRQIHPDDLRRNVGTVLQDVFLFSGSVRDNITLGDPSLADADILRATEISGTHDFIGQTPNGYDLVLADRGAGLSGGQRQSIAIARALVGRPKILILDEPTSAMDTGTENRLVARLRNELAECTFIVITHRPSLLALVDRIVVLDKGKIVAQGPRDQVIKFLNPGTRVASGEAN